MTRLIKTEKDYQQALEQAARLIDLDPAQGTPDGDELELLAFLIESYESDRFPLPKPSPAAAIRFRMEQQGLKAKDLVAIIGSKSQVSEVLSGKRPLTIRMIRALHKELDIPLEVLVNPESENEEKPVHGWQKWPCKEMFNLGWLHNTFDSWAKAQKHAEQLIEDFLKGVDSKLLENAYCRQSVRSNSKMDPHALLAWKIHASKLAQRQRLLGAYQKGTVDQSFISDLIKLSQLDGGILKVEEYLSRAGIHFVVLPHLRHTHLDGAVFWYDNTNPIIALTLRHDRLDNFWFTLAHELAHIALHIDKDKSDCFIDDLETEGDHNEEEADRFARDAMIPARIWRLKAKSLTKEQIPVLAAQLRIHPAIIAGRIRWEQQNYRIHSDLLGRGQVKKHLLQAD